MMICNQKEKNQDGQNLPASQTLSIYLVSDKYNSLWTTPILQRIAFLETVA